MKSKLSRAFIISDFVAAALLPIAIISSSVGFALPYLAILAISKSE
jgi:hypothetical protein